LVSENNLTESVKTVLAFAVDRQADYCSSLCRWVSSGEFFGNTFGRQAIGMVWDFAEVNPFSGSTGDFGGALEWIEKVIENETKSSYSPGHVEISSATSHPLPDDAANLLLTDPPYYDAVPYSHLSDFFYVWLKRILGKYHPDLFSTNEVDKSNEIVVDRPHTLSNSTHDIEYYERELTRAFAEGRRVLTPSGIGTIVFASKTTASWEAILQAVVSAGWIITGSWPIDTEMESRVAAQGQARLASSIHLVCRPRENANGTVPETIGDWRDVLAELPVRIHAWLPRLAAEGVVGADAIFACLGPALEIFSRHSRVEKASGETVTLKEYLEVVWAAVAREALGIIFSGADATGFEEDARLTAMWLWTLKAESGEQKVESSVAEEEDPSSDARPAALGGFSLEYDAARKLAQGLGAHLEKLTGLIEVKGDQARLLPVRERRRSLLGKDNDPQSARKKDNPQMALFESIPDLKPATASESPAAAWIVEPTLEAGATILDRLHQSMLLFADGQSVALKRFLVEDTIGKDQRFWRLADALSALYPSGCDEKRWVDGVLGKKKGLGF
jgi:putative DNA methylase